MKINVTQECIDNGIRENDNDCAVAIAIKEQVPDVDHNSVSVDQVDISFKLLDGTGYRFSTPDPVFEFINFYDQPEEGEEGVGPIAFDLDLSVSI